MKDSLQMNTLIPESENCQNNYYTQSPRNRFEAPCAHFDRHTSTGFDEEGPVGGTFEAIDPFCGSDYVSMLQ